MSWIAPIIKTLAWTIVPVKVMDKGVDHVKSEIREEIAAFEAKYKLLVLIGSAFFLFILFLSVTAGLLISNWLASYSIGFSIVAGSYLCLALILFTVYKKELFK